MDRILLTPSGYEKLEEECARLRVERDRAAEHVRHSLELGGVAAENGEQLDARQELELIEWRLAALEQRLADAEIVASRRDGVVEIGEAVIVLDLERDEVVEYRIVGTGEPDPPADAVTSRSPVGRALLGRGEGDVVEVEAPGGPLRLEILSLDG
jgi:transcription elongation factor GreA